MQQDNRYTKRRGRISSYPLIPIANKVEKGRDKDGFKLCNKTVLRDVNKYGKNNLNYILKIDAFTRDITLSNNPNLFI